MAIVSFIPELWAAKLQLAIDSARVLSSPAVTNRDYEGEVSRHGDVVHINALYDPEIRTYGPSTARNFDDANRDARTVITSDTLDTAEQTMAINQAQYFAFELDDVDAAQAMEGGGLLARGLERAGNRLAEAMDNYVATIVTAGAVSVTGDAVPSDGTPNKAYSAFVAAKLRLDVQNIPQAGRYAVVTPAMYSLLLENPKFIDASQYGAGSVVVSGEVGKILGFTVYMTNLTGGNDLVAGHPMAVTLAQQLTKLEAYRPENTFADAVKGLNVYGAKVLTRPTPGGSSLSVIGLVKVADVDSIPDVS